MDIYGSTWVFYCILHILVWCWRCTQTSAPIHIDHVQVPHLGQPPNQNSGYLSILLWLGCGWFLVLWKNIHFMTFMTTSLIRLVHGIVSAPCWHQQRFAWSNLYARENLACCQKGTAIKGSKGARTLISVWSAIIRILPGIIQLSPIQGMSISNILFNSPTFDKLLFQHRCYHSCNILSNLTNLFFILCSFIMMIYVVSLLILATIVEVDGLQLYIKKEGMYLPLPGNYRVTPDENSALRVKVSELPIQKPHTNIKISYQYKNLIPI